MKRKGISKFGAATISNSWSSSWKPNWRNDEGIDSKITPEPLKKKEGVPIVHKGKFDSQPSKNREVKCFKCLGTWHIASQCPNKRTMILREDGEVELKGNLMKSLSSHWWKRMKEWTILLLTCSEESLECESEGR